MVEAWLEDPNLLMDAVKNMTLAEADRHVVGRCGRALRGAKAAVQNGPPLPSVATWWPAARSRQVALKQAQVTSVAMRLCRMQGLLVSSVDEVLDESSSETMLMGQAALGNAAAVRLLVDAGARRDAADRKGLTALMYAAAAGAGQGVRRRRQHCQQEWRYSRLQSCPEWPHSDSAGAGAGVRRRRQQCQKRWRHSSLHCCPPWPYRASADAGAEVRRRRQHCQQSSNKNGVTPSMVALAKGN